MTVAPSNPTDSARQHRIPELDGMRAFSVLLVIVYHSWLWANTIYVPVSFHWLIDYLGLLGVKIFFVISGFIITRLMLEEVATTGKFSARVFFIKRVFRIIPAYWTYLCLMTLLVVFGVVRSDTINLVPSLLFTSDFLQWGSCFFYAHSWSLSVEEQFYLLFPVMVALVMRRGIRATSLLLLAVYVVVVFSPNVGKLMRINLNTIDIGFLTHFRYIIDGVLLSLWWESFGSLVTRTNWLFPLVLVTCLLGMAYLQFDHADEVFYAKYGFMLVEPTLLAALMGWILYHPARFGLLRWPVVQWLGRISYSVYLWQQLFTGPRDLYLKVPPPGLIGGIALALLCATLSYYFVELPFNALGRRLLPRKKAIAGPRDASVSLSNS